MSNTNKIVKIYDLKPYQGNPRHIRDEKFKKLVKSIREFPEMLNLRPFVVNEDGVILGGNMRYQACIELGIEDVPVVVAEGLSEEQQREFVIKDNVNFGEWDWDVLANEWESPELNNWGLEVWDSSSQLLDIDDVYEPNGGEIQKEIPTPESGSALKFVTYELVMQIENKMELISVLNAVKEKNQFDTSEEALMKIIKAYKI
jgi:hypothetical protein